MIEFYETHSEKLLLIQKSEQKKLKILEKNYSDNDSVNHQTTGDSFENNDSDPQDVFEMIEMPDNGEGENASDSICIEEEEADLPISMRGDLEAPKGDDL